MHEIEPVAQPFAKSVSLPVGVVVRRRPGATRWARWSHQAVAVLPGAGPAQWRLLREADGAAEFHAATLPLTLHRADVEAYRVSLAMRPPSLFVVMRPERAEPTGLMVHAVTASAYEAQDYEDSGEEIVDPVPLPEGLAGWVKTFVDAHYKEEQFVKRRRDRVRTDGVEDGVGDARVRQLADVYRAPGQRKARP